MSMMYHVCWVLLLFSVFFPPLSGASEPLRVGDFSALPQAGALPADWETLVFDGVDRHTQYTHVVDAAGVGVIAAESLNSSSGLVRKIQIDPLQWPLVAWRWKIQKTVTAADLTRKQGDDAAARLYVTFAYDVNQVSWWEKVQFEAIKLVYGEYPPIGALTYVWASHADQGAVMDSPYTRRVKVIVLQTGMDKAGQWVQQQRDIQADYRQAFGVQHAPMISAVAIMTDTDNTGGQAMAWYGDIVFKRSDQNVAD